MDLHSMRPVSDSLADTQEDTRSWMPLIATLLEAKRRQNWLGCWQGLLFVGFMLLSLRSFSLMDPDAGMRFSVTVLIGGSIALFLAGRIGPLRYYSAQKEAIRGLALITSHAAIGPLLEAHAQLLKPRQVRRAIEDRLVALLNSQTSIRHADLSAEEKRILHDLMLNSTNIALRRACLQASSLLGAPPTLLVQARMAVRDFPTPEEQAMRTEAKQMLAKTVQGMDFGTVETIPDWIAQLPNESMPSLFVEDQEWEATILAVFALTRLLPQLTPEQAGLISPNARHRLRLAQGNLWHILTYASMTPHVMAQSRFGPDFTLALLKAFEVAGQGEDLAFVLEMAWMEAPTADLKRIRAKAQEIVPILTERQKAEEMSNVLLRGTSAPPAPANQLLRPANGNPLSEPASELLRPETSLPAAVATATPTQATGRAFVVSPPVEEVLVNRAGA